MRLKPPPPKDESKFIDGSWYEQEYSTEGKHYHEMYTGEVPEWAKQANLYHAHAVLSFLGLPAVGTKLLDMGAGIGQYVTTWESVGVECKGIEISKAAVEKSGRSNIVVGSAADMSCFKDGEFDVCFSSAFMEHIARSITPQVVKEMTRVARFNAHVIPMEKGDDPSHIHIQTVEQWGKELAEILGAEYNVIVVPNVVAPTQPYFFWCKAEDIPWPLAVTVRNLQNGSR